MNKISKEFIKFFFIGILCFFIEYVFYFFFLDFFSINKAKALSFFLASTIAFVFNKNITFKVKFKNKFIYRYIILYIISGNVNVFINLLVFQFLDANNFFVFNVDIISNPYFNYHFAFLFSVGVSMIINFIGLKVWVFK